MNAQPAGTVDDQIVAAPRASFAGRDLRGHHFGAVDLTEADFTGATLTDAVFDGATLVGAVFASATLDGARFLRADLTDADLSQTSAHHCGFGGATLDNASLFGADLTNAALSQASLCRADLRTAVFTDARLIDADLSGAEAARAEFTNADFSGANISGAILHEADLHGVAFRRVTGFEEADWIGANISGADFTGAYLARRFAIDQNYLHEFRNRSEMHGWIYKLWWITSDCGRSPLRWGLWTMAFALFFGVIYNFVDLSTGDYDSPITTFYFSIVTLTTLGYGDVLPASGIAQLVVIIQVMIGYVMLGGLLSIFATKMGRRGE